MPLSESETSELAALLPVARQARRQHRPDSPQGAATARVTAIMAAAVSEGRATVREVSDSTGISYHSVARRVRIATGENVGRQRKRPTAPPETEPQPHDEAETAPEPEEENPSGAQEDPALTGVVTPLFPPDLPNRVEGREVQDVEIPEAFKDSLVEQYGDTRLGSQEPETVPPRDEDFPAPAPRSAVRDPFTSGWKS